MVTSDPYYPRGNALAERCVQTVKNALTKAMEADEDPYITLLELRNTPVDSFMSPARLLVGRNTRSVVPVLNLKNAVVDDDAFQERRTKMQAKQKMYYDKGTRSLEDLEKGDKVVMYDISEEAVETCYNP